MKTSHANLYVCPETHEPLSLTAKDKKGDNVVRGTLAAGQGKTFSIADGIPDLTYPPQLLESDHQAREEYDRAADHYDDAMWFTFQTFKCDEDAERERMIAELKLKPDSRVLEVGAGSGRDSLRIAKHLGEKGLLCVQELSRPFLLKGVDALKGVKPQVEFSIANASYLPFADRTFDAVYHFGGLNTFGDVRRALAEAARVTRVGGRVVMGDEGVGPWLRDTEYAAILVNANEMYGYKPPLAEIPSCARNVQVQWLIGDAFYAISFEVGEGAVEANFDLEVPGARGGTFRTRYEGHLEGVTPEVKKLVMRAREKSGQSTTAWLNRTLASAAKKELGDG